MNDTVLTILFVGGVTALLSFFSFKQKKNRGPVILAKRDL